MGLLLILLFLAGIGYDYHRQEYSRQTVSTIREDKVTFFYRDDCSDCKEVFPTVYWHHFFNRNVQFVNLNQEQNRTYIDQYTIHSVPTLIYQNEAYAGTDREEIKHILGKGSKNWTGQP